MKRPKSDVLTRTCRLVHRSHEKKVRQMISCMDDHNLVSSSFDNSPLRSVDLNRQLSIQNVGEVHERICREMPVPATLVDKIVAFHLGQFTLSVENLTQLFLFLDTRFRRFAHTLDAFQNLDDEDKETLLTSNAPLYFQLHLARYINSHDGLTQVTALLGKGVPEDLTSCDKFLTVSFRYFASALVLFSDKTSMELYEDRASTLNHVTDLHDDRTLGQLAACLLFFRENCHSMYNRPTDISRAYEHALKSSAASFDKKSHWSTVTNLISAIKKLKQLVHFYSLHANIREPVQSSTFDPVHDDLFEDTIVLDSYNEEISLTSIPHPASAQEEETFWVSRQLNICDTKAKQEINFGEDGLREAAMLFLLHEDAPLSNKFFLTAFRTLTKRAHLLLRLHHEYGDIASSCDNPNVALYQQQLESNVIFAAAFAFAVIFDEMSSSNVYGGLLRLMGNDDQKLWQEQYSMLVPDSICVERNINLSFLGLPMGLLHTYISVATKLRETSGHLSNDLLTLIQLSMLWKGPDIDDVSPRNMHQTIVQASSLSERYLYHLSEQLSKNRIPADLTQHLFSAAPFTSFESTYQSM